MLYSKVLDWIKFSTYVNLRIGERCRYANILGCNTDNQTKKNQMNRIKGILYKSNNFGLRPVLPDFFSGIRKSGGGNAREYPYFPVGLWPREGGISERSQDVRVRERQATWESGRGNARENQACERERGREKNRLLSSRFRFCKKWRLNILLDLFQ